MVSFFENAITTACVQSLAFVRQQPFIQDFYLAGGTALALQSGHRVSTDAEPLRTLATYRKVGGKVIFGQNLVHHGAGLLRLGDPVEILA